jgi:decaprenylphospho-beta-D-erythro-pentofuranosid-2-ulose 2-reductase
MSKILIIGATSTIAQHCARLWAARGEELYLVGRSSERLEQIAADLRVRGATKVLKYVLDLNDFDGHQAMLDTVEKEFGGLDIVLVAHGTLSDQKACEKSVSMSMQEIKTNALSVIALLTLIANLFEEKGNGTIAVISSVAGDRGRASNYVYGSAKAMVTSFNSGLRQRLHRSGVSVLTIKPGFVDTPMTKNFKKGIMWSNPSAVAKGIVGSIDKKIDEIYLPAFWRAAMLAIRAIPVNLFKMLRL